MCLSDAPAWHELRCEAVTDAFESPVVVERERSLPIATIEQEIREECVFGAFSADGRLLGATSVAPRPPDDFEKMHMKPDDVVELRLAIRAVAVHRCARKQGIGRKLVLKCIAHARSQGACRLLLTVQTANETAKTLYESLGFKVWGDPGDETNMQICF